MLRYLATVLAAWSALAPLMAQTPPNLDDVMRADTARARARLATMPDTPGSGGYPATKGIDPAFPGHVVYRPANLAAAGRMPVLLWGNGGCAADGAGARLFLSEIASHGYVVVAPGAILSGPGAPTPPAAPANGAPPALAVKTTWQDVRRGIEQATAANADPRSPWHDHVDLTRVAVAGTSCGGLQALQLAADPRIKAVIVLHSGIFPAGQQPIAGLTIDKSALKALHTPVLYILGGPMDVAYPNGTDDFARIDTVPVFLADHDVHHSGTFADPNGGSEANVAVNWLDWQLRGDRRAARMFTGPTCGLCTDPGWKVRRKRIG